jgi:hypothetical protein
MTMAEDLATKLRLTEAVLGCAGRKDLAARFRAVNPRTHFDLERAHKWAQGRAAPRSQDLYLDWAKVLGTSRGGAWIATCSVAAFEAELAALFGIDAAQLRRLAGIGGGTVERAPQPPTASFDLDGHFACYSYAWSPHYRGALLRASLTIARGRRGAAEAIYCERLMGGTVSFSGEVMLEIHTLHMLLRGPRGVAPLFVSLLRPGPPGSVLCGVMSGAVAVGPQPLPSSTRLVVVRVGRDPSSSNRYFWPAPGALVADLTDLGLVVADGDPLDRLMQAALTSAAAAPGLDQVAMPELTALAMVLDQAWLHAQEQLAAAG